MWRWTSVAESRMGPLEPFTSQGSKGLQVSLCEDARGCYEPNQLSSKLM